MEVEVGSTEILRGGEPRVSNIDRIASVTWVFSLGLGEVGELLEPLAKRRHVPGFEVFRSGQDICA